MDPLPPHRDSDAAAGGVATRQSRDPGRRRSRGRARPRERRGSTHQDARSIRRDVRDVVLSEYRWELRDGVQRTLDEQIDLTLASGTPMSLFGSWRDHVTYWLGTEAARRGDLLVVKFEEFRRDPRAKLDEVLRFLGVDAEESYIEAAIRNNSVERMREREGRAVNAGISGGDPSYPWIGQGAVMGWRSKLTPEQAERLGAGVRDVLTRLGYPTGDQPDTS
jgi:hypothetical protein